MTEYISPFQADIVGFIGSFFIVAAFAYSNISKAMNLLLFNAVNFLGAALLAISLTVNFNLPSMMLQFVWMGIALLGAVKAAMQPRAKNGKGAGEGAGEA